MSIVFVLSLVEFIISMKITKTFNVSGVRTELDHKVTTRVLVKR